MYTKPHEFSPLSLTPGGVTVVVIDNNGFGKEYHNIKYPSKYITKVKSLPNVKDAYVKKD